MYLITWDKERNRQSEEKKKNVVISVKCVPNNCSAVISLYYRLDINSSW